MEGTEFDVVADDVVASLGANEKMTPGVVLDAAADVAHEVIGGSIATAAIAALHIKTSGLDAGAAEDFESEVVGQDLRGVDGVEIVKEGAIGKVDVSGEVGAVVPAPGEFGLHADAFVEEPVGAGSGISAAVEGLRLMVAGGETACGRVDRSAADGNVNLLGASGGGEGEGENGENKGEAREAVQWGFS